MNSPEIQEKPLPARIKNRPFLCRIILSMALTYFLILALLFLAGSLFSKNIVQAVSPYYGHEESSPEVFRWFILAAAALYSFTAAGIILMLLCRKFGFYIFIVAAIIIFSLDLAFLNFDWLRYLIHTGFVFAIGIAHFSKRCYHKHDKT